MGGVGAQEAIRGAAYHFDRVAAAAVDELGLVLSKRIIHLTGSCLISYFSMKERF